MKEQITYDIFEKIDIRLGDIRDFDSVLNACNSMNYIFHAAALKQVPSCEFYPIEAVKTWITGAFIGRLRTLAIISTGIGNPHPPKYRMDTNNADSIRLI